jgi:hypothetical protein
LDLIEIVPFGKGFSGDTNLASHAFSPLLTPLPYLQRGRMTSVHEVVADHCGVVAQDKFGGLNASAF